MTSEKKGEGEQNENDEEDAQCATKDIPKTSSSATPEAKESPPRVSENGTEQPSKTQAEQAAKLDIKLSPEIILFMKVLFFLALTDFLLLLKVMPVFHTPPTYRPNYFS